jgi:hypothetical protein
MTYKPDNKRYNSMKYNRCGRSGLKLSALSLGLWHNFGENDNQTTAKEMIYGAFDLGITHFDLANNYGPPAGSAEETFGKIIKEGLMPHRDEMIITTIPVLLGAGVPLFGYLDRPLQFKHISAQRYLNLIVQNNYVRTRV